MWIHDVSFMVYISSSFAGCPMTTCGKGQEIARESSSEPNTLTQPNRVVLFSELEP